jgi:hypothetical protein
MKTLVCTLVLAAGTLSLCAAGEPAAPNTTAPSAPATEQSPAPEAAAPALELKNKSSFTMEVNSRNPFWPIGWKPSPKQSANPTEHVGPELSANAFLVSSITVDTGGRFAIINGKAMTEGQMFGLQMGNQTYQITVKAIQDGQVILSRRDQEIPVPLRRR